MLITPGDVSVGVALAESTVADGWKVALTVSDDIPAAEARERESPYLIQSNVGSLLSARKALLNGLNVLEGLDAAIVVHEAVQDERPVHELSPVAIERYIDNRLKSLFLMLREILSLFVRQGSGILAMVNYVPQESALLPLCSAATAAFRATTDSLVTLYQNEHIFINGFECTDGTPERFSRFMLPLLSGKAGETSGKWYRCGGSRSVSRVFRK